MGGRGRTEGTAAALRLFIPVLSAQAPLSFRSTSASGRGADGFLEAPVPKWVLVFKITHSSNREPPPQAQGEEKVLFFFISPFSCTHYLSLFSVAVIESTD